MTDHDCCPHCGYCDDEGTLNMGEPDAIVNGIIEVYGVPGVGKSMLAATFDLLATRLDMSKGEPEDVLGLPTRKFEPPEWLR